MAACPICRADFPEGRPVDEADEINYLYINCNTHWMCITFLHNYI